MGGTELEGGIIPNAVVVISYLLRRIAADDAFGACWLPEWPAARLDLLREAEAALLRCMPLAKAHPEASRETNVEEGKIFFCGSPTVVCGVCLVLGTYSPG